MRAANIVTVQPVDECCEHIVIKIRHSIKCIGAVMAMAAFLIHHDASDSDITVSLFSISTRVAAQFRYQHDCRIYYQDGVLHHFYKRYKRNNYRAV
jgi:hypothetical protein